MASMDMASMDIDSDWLSYTALFSRVNASDSSREVDFNSGFLGSLVAQLLLIFFTLYLGIILVIFALECYHFLLVWNLVSRTRAHSGEFPQVRDIWNSRFRGPTSSDLGYLFVKEARRPHSEHSIVQCLDISTYQEMHDMSTGNSCTICLSEFQPNEQVATIRKCLCRHHVVTPNRFHQACLTQWLKENPSCPYCRDEILAPPSPSANSLHLTDSLEMASLRAEHHICNAFAAFGEFLAAYTY